MKRIVCILLIVQMLTVAFNVSASGFCTNPDAIEKAAQSVFMLEVYDNGNEMFATGSGFVMFEEDTLITNYHVIENAYSIIAYDDGGYKYDITELLAADEEKDLAILKFSKPTQAQPLEYSMKKINRGESVVAIGSPVGLRNVVSTGNVSALYNENGTDLIQVTSPISHGSSGGVLLNDDGKVIGVTSSTITTGQNLNFAINVSEVIKLYLNSERSEILLSDYWKTRIEDYYLLGIKFYYGNEVAKDYKKAFDYFIKSAQLGNDKAMNKVGECYEFGTGVKKDPKLAVDWYNKAIEFGNSDACVNLGYCYSQGEIVAKDRNKAFELFLQAAIRGNSSAIVRLGIYFLDNNPIKEDIPYAISLIESVANNPNDAQDYAMLILGEIYNVYLDDQIKAREWYQKGADLGNEDCIYALKNLK